MSDHTPPPSGGYASVPPPPPPGGGYGGYGGVPQGSPPPNHLVWAILSTLFCCLPLGVVSIVFSAQVNGKWSAGDVDGAQNASAKARTYALWGTIVGVILYVLVVALFVGLIAVGSSSSTTAP